jgi:hypothetical protein
MPHGQCVVVLWFGGNSTEMRFDFAVFDRLTRLKPTSSANSRHCWQRRVPPRAHRAPSLSVSGTGFVGSACIIGSLSLHE